MATWETLRARVRELALPRRHHPAMLVALLLYEYEPSFKASETAIRLVRRQCSW